VTYKNDVATNQVRKNRSWQIAAVVIALLHISLWVSVAFSYPRMENIEPLVPIDFPLSLVLVALGWNSPHLMIWFGVLGTLWWYALVRLTGIGLTRVLRNQRRDVDQS
jgi:hypothetical protein